MSNLARAKGLEPQAQPGKAKRKHKDREFRRGKAATSVAASGSGRSFAEHDLAQLNRCETGAGEGIRTLDPNLGKVVLYP